MAEAETDISSLTEEQQLALQQYTSVTDQDVSAAIPLLRRCEWNVQIAIARFFDGETAQPVHEDVPQTPAPEDIRRRETLATAWDNTPRRRNIALEPAPRIAALPESQRHPPAPILLSLALAPINIVLGLFSRLYNLVSYFLPFVPRLVDRLTAGTTYSSRQTQTSTQGNASTPSTIAFLENLTRTHGIHNLPFLQTTYARAYDLAKKDLKPLLVIPVSPSHASTNTFLRDVLLSPSVKTLLANSSHNLLLWINTTSDSETYRAASTLGVTSFPAAVLIAPIPSGSSSSAPTMSILARLCGSAALAATTFTRTIETALARHAPSLSRARNAKTEQDAVRNLREEQNSAYERSLAQDRERARAKRETKEKAEREEKEKDDRIARQQQRAHDLANWRRWRASKIQGEPGADIPAAEVVRVSIRVIDGERVIRKFLKASPMEEMYAFVECVRDLRALESGDGKVPATPPPTYEHRYGFKLVSPMPRVEYDINAGGTVGEELGRSANLIAERIDESEGE